MTFVRLIHSKMTSGSDLTIKEALTATKCNDDIVCEILLRLPLKSLIKSRTVCKWWSRLISDPIFIANYSLRHPDHRVSGLFTQKFFFLSMYPNSKFINFNGQENDTFSEFSLSFIEDKNGVCIQHSANGLLLCSSFRCHENERIYYICQPRTKQYYTLPQPKSKNVHGINIAFDPFKSLFIRVVCIVESEVLKDHYQVKIYSSDEKLWRESGKPFVKSDGLVFNRGVFWNGGLYWVSREIDLLLRFDVEQELLFKMPMPEIIEGKGESERRLGYFGVSGEHLYMVHIYGSQTSVFDVMEMMSDYSGWFVKYHVDLTLVSIHYRHLINTFSFSIMNIDHQCKRRRRKEICYASLADAMEVAAAAEDDDDEDEDEEEEGVIEESESESESEEEELCTMLQFHIPGKIISYNLDNMSFMELQKLSIDPLSSLDFLQGEYRWERVHPYTNTFYYI